MARPTQRSILGRSSEQFVRIPQGKGAFMSAACEQLLNEPETSSYEDNARCVLHVCTSCRASGAPREPKEGRAGFILYQRLSQAFDASSLKDQVEVIPTPCLSICPRPCGIALSRGGSWTYLFGDQDPNQTTQDVVECVSFYLQSPEGVMARAQRPESLRRSILGRVPPMPEAEHASS